MSRLAWGLVAAALAILCVVLVETSPGTGQVDPQGRLDCLNNAFRNGDNPDVVCP
jgi:hypothetical protein